MLKALHKEAPVTPTLWSTKHLIFALHGLTDIDKGTFGSLSPGCWKLTLPHEVNLGLLFINLVLLMPLFYGCSICCFGNNFFFFFFFFFKKSLASRKPMVVIKHNTANRSASCWSLCLVLQHIHCIYLGGGDVYQGFQAF